MTDVIALKSLAIVGFLVVVLAICPLPLYSKFFNPPTSTDDSAVTQRTRSARARAAARLCSFANSLAGGLFVSIGLIHLLPEAAESFRSLYPESVNDQYRPAFCVCFGSYSLLLLIQRVIFSDHGHSHGDHENGHTDPADVSPADVYVAALPLSSEAPPTYGAADDALRKSLVSTHTVTPRQSGRHLSAVDAAARASIRTSTRRSDVLVRIVLEHTDASAGGDDESEGGDVSQQSLFGVADADNTAARRSFHHHDHDHDHGSHDDGAPGPVRVTKVVTSIVLVLAFSLHGLAEGIALGVQSDPNAALLMLLAIAMHKWAEALSIGMSFQKSGLPRRQCLVYIFAFSLSSPLGVSIGWASEALLPQVVSAYLMAFSTGTFLYLGASDVLVEEFANGGKNVVKFFLYLFGAAVIFVVSAFLDRDSADGSSSGGE